LPVWTNSVKRGFVKLGKMIATAAGMSVSGPEPDRTHPLVRLANLLDQALAADAVLGRRANPEAMEAARCQLWTAAHGMAEAATELIVLARRERYPTVADPSPRA